MSSGEKNKMQIQIMLSGEILTNKGWERVGGAMTFQPHR